MMTVTKQRIATIKGTFAVPGVSKNRRLYTRDHIAGAVNEAQSLIANGNAPIVAMLTHHGARDPKFGDVTRTAGRITKVGLTSDGHGTFEADIADTTAGHDVAALTTPDEPYLRGVSMASTWKGNVHTVSAPDGSGPCETADGFSLKGIDFTHSPGVPGAEIKSAELAEAADAGLILESLEEVIFVEQTGGAPVPVTEADDTNVTYADPGYQPDKKKRYPLTTAKKVRAAWAFINQSGNSQKYTAVQFKRIRSKIKTAAKKFDVNIAEELQLLGTEILEAYASVCLDNGPGSITVSGYTDDPAQLAKVGQSVAMAALAGLYQLDPDTDGDIDRAGGSGDDDDDESDSSDCPSCNSVVPAGALYCPTCGAAVPQGESAHETKGATMPENTEDKGAATESTLSITQAQLDAAVAAGAKAALESAGIAPAVTESAEVLAARKLIAEADAGKTPVAPVVTESTGDSFTKDEVKAMLTEAAETATKAALDVARKEIQEAGPRRRGYVSPGILEQSPEEVYGEKPLHAMTNAELEKLADVVASPLIGV